MPSAVFPSGSHTGPAVDTHAHVFDRSCRLVEPRRYTPAREAPTKRYLAALERFDIRFGVIVQPSFLGTDNGYLLQALAEHPGRLRGVAVVAPDASEQSLAALRAAGVRGIRWNLIGHDPALVAGPEVRALNRRAAGCGLLVEVQARGADLALVLDALLGDNGTVVVDHFGLPVAPDPLDDEGFRTLAGLACEEGLFVKLSAPYRFAPDADAYAVAILEALGPKRLVWGSDWPWTRHEAETSYAACIADFTRWFGAHAQEVNATARALFGFPATPQ